LPNNRLEPPHQTERDSAGVLNVRFRANVISCSWPISLKNSELRRAAKV
jgi:hypothetical protein